MPPVLVSNKQAPAAFFCLSFVSLIICFLTVRQLRYLRNCRDRIFCLIVGYQFHAAVPHTGVEI